MIPGLEQLGTGRGRAASTNDMPRPVTLAELASKGLDVWAWCNDCCRHAVLPIDTLTDKLGPEYPVPHVARRTVCRECGSRDVQTRPDWPTTGVVARH